MTISDHSCLSCEYDPTMFLATEMKHIFKEQKPVLGPLDVKVKVKPKKFRNNMILHELPIDL